MAINLVDGDLILHRLDDAEALDKYCTTRGLKKSNMKELLGNGREGVCSGFKYNHALLGSLRWIKSDSGVIMPVLSYDHAVKYLKEREITLNRNKLKDVVLGRTQKLKEVDASGKVVRIWKKIGLPRVIYALADGTSLYGLENRAAAQPVLPDFAAPLWPEGSLNLPRGDLSRSSNYGLHGERLREEGREGGREGEREREREREITRGERET